MTQQSFNERIGRINARAGGGPLMMAGLTDLGEVSLKRGAAEASPLHGKRAGVGFILLAAVIVFPVGGAVSLVTRATLDSGVTLATAPQPAVYLTFLGGAALAHVMLLGGVAAAVLDRFRRRRLNWSLFFALAGYGAVSSVI